MGIAIVNQRELQNLIAEAQNGDEIILMRDGKPVAKLAATSPEAAKERRHATLDKYRGAAKPFWNDDDTAERSQDFLYDEFGLPK